LAWRSKQLELAHLARKLRPHKGMSTTMLGCSLCTRMTESCSQPCMSTPHSELWGGYSCLHFLSSMGHGWQRRIPTREAGIRVTLPSLSVCGGGFLCQRTRPGGDDWWIRRCGLWRAEVAETLEPEMWSWPRKPESGSHCHPYSELWRCGGDIPIFFFSMRTNRVILGYSRAYPCWPSFGLVWLLSCWPADCCVLFARLAREQPKPTH